MIFTHIDIVIIWQYIKSLFVKLKKTRLFYTSQVNLQSVFFKLKNK